MKTGKAQAPSRFFKKVLDCKAALQLIIAAQLDREGR
jgi:hypothetical protein